MAVRGLVCRRTVVRDCNCARCQSTKRELSMPKIKKKPKPKPLVIGTPLYGYCGGYFGRDSYADKRVEAIGHDWIVVRDDRGEVWFASGTDIHSELAEYTIPEEEDEDDY